MLANDEYTPAWTTAFARGTKLKYNKGEFIIRPGDAPRGVFFIESGLVKAYNITKYGEENLLIIRKTHEIFPIIWAVTGSERQIIYQTLLPTTVWRLSREDFLAHIESSSDASTALMVMSVDMYRVHSERIINLEYRTVRERLISFMLTMSRRFGKDTKDGLLLDVPLRQQDIASSINASRETTSRELSGLEKKGLIKNSSQYITILDKAKLKAYL